MTYEEIAETTDIPLNTVKTYIFRAKKELYQKLRALLTHFYIIYVEKATVIDGYQILQQY